MNSSPQESGEELKIIPKKILKKRMRYDEMLNFESMVFLFCLGPLPVIEWSGTYRYSLSLEIYRRRRYYTIKHTVEGIQR